MKQDIYVQYGCGLSAPAEWLNFDASPTLFIQRLPLIGLLPPANRPRFPNNVRYGDIVKGLPLSPKGACAVYCSHVLEHLSLSDFRVALRNTRSILRDDGIFRLVVPDLRTAVDRYANDKSNSAAIRFMTDTYLGTVERKRGIGGLVRSWLGNGAHLWMWDLQSLRRELATAGFTNIRAAIFGDSEEPLFAAVEDKERWEDAVGIQCQA